VPIEMLQVIPDPELSVTEADINLQLREALILTTAVTDPDLDTALLEMETIGSGVNAKVGYNEIAAQADYVSLLGLDGDNMDWNYLDADDDAEISLF
jgi:hypothetical protein